MAATFAAGLAADAFAAGLAATFAAGLAADAFAAGLTATFATGLAAGFFATGLVATFAAGLAADAFATGLATGLTVLVAGIFTSAIDHSLSYIKLVSNKNIQYEYLFINAFLFLHPSECAN